MKADKILSNDGYKWSLLVLATYSVLSDSEGAASGILCFLAGNFDYLRSIDTNHNEKNGRYRVKIGGNTVNSIINCVIDNGLLWIICLPLDFLIIQVFSSDLNVLFFKYGETAANHFNLES